MIKTLSLSIFFFFLSLNYSPAQDEAYRDTASDQVKTVWFEKEGWRLAYPVVTLDNPVQITLHFDILDGKEDVLYYSIIHCNIDWQASDLFTSDFLEGFEENQVPGYTPSFNTTVSYAHYSLDLPNRDIQFKISGNYVLLVYYPGDADKPLLTRRFFVSEGTSSASVTFRRPMVPGKTDTHQQALISIATGKIGVRDPYHDIVLTVVQNGRWDRAKTILKPDVVSSGTVEYNTISEKTLFPGGNEFRYFDIKNIRENRQNVRAIDFVNGRYQVLLLPSEDREFRQYFFDEDLNGRYFIALEGSNEPDVDADYAYVLFTLPVTSELVGGTVYVTGALTDWSYGPSGRMTYNPSKRCYEAVLLLKQGWYNYEFVFVPDGDMPSDRYYLEGSHYETENDYLILTYFRDPSKRYDRLTGVTIANTRLLK